MNRDTVLGLLRDHLPVPMERFGAQHLRLFGRVARDSARPDRNVDVRVGFDGPATAKRCFGVPLCTHLPAEVRALAPDLPWRDVIGTRNRLARANLGMDADTVWGTVADELPALRKAL